MSKHGQPRRLQRDADPVRCAHERRRITPGASYTEPALRRAIVEFVKTLDLNDVTLAGESMGATLSLT